MLQLHNIGLQLGSFRLASFNLHIQRGEYRVLLGPTGTGKTVLLETIAGLHTPHRGTLILDGRDITNTVPEKRHIGVVYQNYALFPHLNVFDNIAFGLRIQGRSNKSIKGKVMEMADFLGIRHFLIRSPRNLSGGECQRVALARALVLEPEMLLLDEPLSAVDRLTRDRLQGELKRIHQQLAITILHITHDLNEAFFLADTITVMREGIILQEGTPDEISLQPATRFVAELMGMKNFLPAQVHSDESLEVPGMGRLPAHLFSSPLPKNTKKILIGFPDWSVDFFPTENERYWWRGKMRITDIHTIGSRVEIELSRTDDIRIHTSFSKREAGRFATALIPDQEITVGICREGLHWTPVK
jgi:ABC-type Fe3+/spermidine/putrescine transport system ATPase subunit